MTPAYSEKLKPETTTYPALEEVLPHAQEAILLDEIIRCGTEDIECLVRVNPKKFPPYAATMQLPCWIGLEYMAQAVAAYNGIQRRQSEKKMAAGLFLGSRQINFHVVEFHAGQVLLISAEKVWYDQTMGVFACKITDAVSKALLAAGELNVYHPQNPNELLEKAGQAQV